MTENTPQCSILWSTQTGRAKACARRTARILRSQKGLNILGEGCEFDCDAEFMHPKSNRKVLFLFVSTTGDGEQCDSISETWKALRSKSLPRDLFSNVSFALFCLGDRAYGPLFCAGGRKLAARLVQLGASPFCGVGFGDDGTPNGGVFYDLDVWLETTLLPAIDKRFDGLQSPISPTFELERPPIRYSVCVLKDETDNNTCDSIEEWERDTYNALYNSYFETWCPMTAYQYSKSSRLEQVGRRTRSPPLLAKVLKNDRITASDWEQDTRHLQIRIKTKQNDSESTESSHLELPYQAGDVATVLPFNTDKGVSTLLNVLPSAIRAVADHELEITPIGSGSNPWPRRCTLRGLLTYCADIGSLPEREDLRVLAYYCQQEHEMGRDQRKKLVSLSETSGAALFADYILREKRNWSDVLYDFDSIRWEGSTSASNHALTLEALLSLLPAIRPRDFSIASAPSYTDADHSLTAGDDLKHNSSFDIELCVAVVGGTTPLGRTFHGLCSNFLSNNTPDSGRLLRLWIRPGSFGKLPLETAVSTDGQTRFETPILCVGAGTGIAPLRSLLLERVAVLRQASHQGRSNSTVNGDKKQSNDADSSLADNILIFGCRKEACDYYYRDEWETLVLAGQLTVMTAFSRDQWHKIYVQQVIGKANNGMLIAQHVLESGGAMYVAGGAKMAKSVKDEIRECIEKRVGENQAKLVLRKLQQTGRYSVEAWS